MTSRLLTSLPTSRMLTLCSDCQPGTVETLLIGILSAACDNCGKPGSSPELGRYWLNQILRAARRDDAGNNPPPEETPP